MRYAGVDEVGYGALAGNLTSVVVAIDVNVPPGNFASWWPVRAVRDSKKTTFAQREAMLPDLVRFLVANRASVGIGDVPPSTIDRYGYSQALLWSKLDALAQVNTEGRPDILIVDGSVGLGDHGQTHDIEQRVEPQADARYWIVAAASIIAKQHRDRQMLELACEFPEYGFAENKGYAGGGQHVEALRRHGLTPHHRKQACRTILSRYR